MNKNLENEKEEINETSAYEPIEEGFDQKKENKAKIGWIIFFSVVVVLMAVCYIVIRSIPVN